VGRAARGTFAHRRSRWMAISVIVIAAAVVAVLVVPFGKRPPPANGYAGNSFKTSTTAVQRRTISSQLSTSATLGYGGTVSVALPTGTAAGAVTQAQSTEQAAAQKVAADRAALASARRLAGPTRNSTLTSARALVATDQSTVNAAALQLSNDQNLGCPAASSATVSQPLDRSGATSSAPAGPAAAPGAAPAAPRRTAHSSTTTTTTASPPTAQTGGVNATTSTSTTVTGTVSPNGDDTTYYVQYGTSPNFGDTSGSAVIAGANGPTGVDVPLGGLTPGMTYYYRLVAESAAGLADGASATFTTSSTPGVSTGSPASASATTETLTGTVTPNGLDTTYYFEWGSSAAFGNVTPTTDAGGDFSPVSVTATISGLTPNTAYDVALVATNALGTTVGATVVFESAQSSCSAESAVLRADRVALIQAEDALREDVLSGSPTVASADAQLTNDETALATAQHALSLASSSQLNPSGTFTDVAPPGRVIRRGQMVYQLDATDVPLLYGTTTPYRALYLGVAPGPDVAQLTRNLIALGFARGLGVSPDFTAGTASAVEAWQSSLGRPATGIVALGDYVVAPGPLDVATTTAADGQAAQPGAAVLTATSTTPVVTIALSTDSQGLVKVGDPVTVTLPDGSTTPGAITSVGSVATTPSSSQNNGGPTSPTITVIVTLTHPSAAGHLDQAPVTVSITDQTAANALVVPVTALLALSGGGYALEVVGAGGTHTLEAVTTGIFDDAHGLVSVTGPDVAAGQRVVIPAT
jgi:Putative peptidoglycan binding domain